MDVVDGAPQRWTATTSLAPMVTLFDRTGGELVAAQAASQGPSTTISAAATARSKTLVLATATSVASDDVLLLGKNQSGQWEWITVDSVNTTSKVVTTRDELQYSYESGVTVKSHRLSVVLSSTNCDGVFANCRARWSFVVSGVKRYETTLFHVSVWSPRMTLRDQDVLVRQPRAIDLLGSRQRLHQLIADVWEHDILEDLGRDYNPGALVSGDALHQAHLYRVLLEISIMGADQSGQDRYSALYRSSWDRAIAQTLIDSDGDGEIGDEDVVRSSMTGRVRRAG